MCDGNCAACATPCAASKLLKSVSAEPKTTKEKGENTMSQSLGGCHSGNEEKIGRLDERSQFNIERNHNCKLLCISSFAVALIAAFIAWTAMRDIQNLRVDLATMQESTKQELRRAVDMAEDAKLEATRGYNYVRKNKRHL